MAIKNADPHSIPPMIISLLLTIAPNTDPKTNPILNGGTYKCKSRNRLNLLSRI